MRILTSMQLTPEERAKDYEKWSIVALGNKRVIMKTKRYFKYDLCEEEPPFDLEIHEITKKEFDSIDGDFDTDEHSMFENGVDQICYTKHNGFVG